MDEILWAAGSAFKHLIGTVGVALIIAPLIFLVYRWQKYHPTSQSEQMSFLYAYLRKTADSDDRTLVLSTQLHLPACSEVLGEFDLKLLHDYEKATQPGNAIRLQPKHS